MNSPLESVPEEPERTSARTHAEAVERLHAEFACVLERIAWAILRDWPLASDAVQETFALLSQQLDAVPVAQRAGWLIKTVQFQSHNLRRKQQRADQLLERYGSSGLVREPADAYHTGSPTAEASLESQEEADRIQRAIAKLPAAQRTVVHMRLAEEQSFAEIAAALNVPLGTVLSRMRLALEKLRSELKS